MGLQVHWRFQGLWYGPLVPNLLEAGPGHGAHVAIHVTGAGVGRGALGNGHHVVLCGLDGVRLQVRSDVDGGYRPSQSEGAREIGETPKALELEELWWQGGKIKG